LTFRRSERNDSFLLLENDAWKRAVSEYRDAKDVLAQAKELEEEAKDRIGNIMSSTTPRSWRVLG
jgi:hypothetical protein